MAKKKATKDKKVTNDDMFTSAEEAMQECINLSVIPTSPSIDIKLGGGIPEGSFVLIRSRPKVGKTSLVMQIVQNALEQGRKVVFVDAERRLTGYKYFQVRGFDIKNPKFKILRSKKGKILSGEEIYFEVIAMMKNPEYAGALFVIDSFSRIVGQDTLDDPNVRADRRDTGPKLNEDFCKKVGNLLRVNRCVLIGVQHMMTDTSPMGMGKLIPKGGNGLEYDADIVLESRHRQLDLNGESIAMAKDEDELTGQMARWDLPYNKLLAPYVSKENDQKILNYFLFGEGVWWAKEALPVLEELGLLVRGGAWYTFTTDQVDKKVQGTDNAIELINENREYFQKIIQEHYTATYEVSFDFVPPELEESAA